jgi:hypothetical protein
LPVDLKADCETTSTETVGVLRPTTWRSDEAVALVVTRTEPNNNRYDD